MRIATKREKAGRYRLERDDGLVVEAVAGAGKWWCWSVTWPTLAMIKFDMKRGYGPFRKVSS